MKKLKLRIYINILMIFLIIFLNYLPVQAEFSPPENNKAQTTQSENSNEMSASSQSTINYFIPGDGLNINTFPDTSSFLNRTFPIDDSGFIEFPIIGRVNISKMTEQELVDFIKNNFRNYTRSPNVFVKPMLRVSIIGGFIRPGLYYVDYNSSFWEMIREAGGPILEDGIEEMYWERSGKNMTENLPLFIERGISLKRMGLKSGDLVWTPTPGAETTWDKIITDVLPILAFASTMFLMWITYQRTVTVTR